MPYSEAASALSTPSSSSTHLSAEDAQRFLKFLPELYALGDMTTFPEVSLRIINQLLPALVSTYNEIDLRSGVARVLYEPARFEERGEHFKPGLWRHRLEHPLMQRYEQNLNDGVWKISDFLDEPQLHSLAIYREVLQPMQIEDTMSFTLQSSVALKVFYAINASQRFTERDRAVAALLQPHLVQAFENSVAFTDARALALLSTRALNETSEHGLVLTESSGRIVYANERANTDLVAAFPYHGAEILPPEVQQWISRHEPELLRALQPLEITRGTRTFVFRAARADAAHWFIASREHDASQLTALLRDSFGLTERQSDILLWLARGKSNLEIAGILSISHRTVAKHAEGLFDKLGVDNRKSAMLRALEVVGA